MRLRILIPIALLTALTLLPVLSASDDVFHGVVVKKPFDGSVNKKGPGSGSTQILYHGGPVMNQSNAVYVIYYGSFPATTQPIINDFLAALSGSNAYGVNTTYSDLTQAVPPTYLFLRPSIPPTANTRSGSVYWDNYSQGTQLGTSSIPNIVARAINLSTGLPPDDNGVYLVVTAPDVKISGFCNSFCAYHTTSATVVSGYQIRYALIPDPTQRCSACNGGMAVYGDTVTPNGDMGADTMTDDIMHELSETVTDPDLNAWYTKSGAENGDLCNYVYGPVETTQVAGATAHYNVVLGNRPFLIQEIWKNSGAGFCAAQ